MLYIILIHASERSEKEYADPALQQQMDEYNDRLDEAGVKVMAKGITPSHLAKRIAFRNEGKLLTQGPFSPIEEQISGFFLLDVATEEEALHWFNQVPDPIGDGQGLIELRRLY